MIKKFLFSIVLVAAISSCRKEKTSWDSDWVVPIVNDTLSLRDLENDSTINANLSTFYQVDLTRTILDFGIEDFIEIPDTTINQSYNIAGGNLLISPGFSIVNQIEEHTLEMNGIQLKKIRISNGSIKMRVFNPIETKALFTVQLPGVSKNGILFEEFYTAPAGTSANPGFVDAVLDLSGYEIDLTGINGSDYNVLQSRLVVKSDPTGPSVNISASDVFKVEAEFKKVKIDYARGYFGNQAVSDTTAYAIDFMNNVISGTLDIPATSLQFEVLNGLKVAAKATITHVKNINNSGNTVNLTNAQLGTPIYLDPATGNWASLGVSSETIEFTSSNSNIESYLENLGKTHEIGYKIELNPWGNNSGGWNEIFPNSRLKVKLKAQMPLAIGADGLTLRDTFDFDVKPDPEKSRIESGMLVLDATNAFPISSDVKLYLMDENGLVLYTVVGTSEIESSKFGTVDPADGMQKIKSEVNFILTEQMLDDLHLIKNVAVEARFNTPDPVTSTNELTPIPAGAFLAVKLKAKLKLKAVI